MDFEGESSSNISIRSTKQDRVGGPERIPVSKGFEGMCSISRKAQEGGRSGDQFLALLGRLLFSLNS